MRRLLILVLAALVLGCQRAPAPGPTQGPVPTAADRLRAEAATLLASGDYQAAARELRELVSVEPEDVSARFNLGTAYSHLDRRREAVEQFRWVLARGRPDSTEVQVARQWLASVGALPAAARPAAPESAETGEPAAGPSPDPAPGRSNLRGRVEWGSISPRDRLISVHVTLAGEDDATREVNATRRFRLGERYVFPDLPPGRYRLTGRAGESRTALWDREVRVEAGKDTVLDLSTANSPVRPDAFPRPED